MQNEDVEKYQWATVICILSTPSAEMVRSSSLHYLKLTEHIYLIEIYKIYDIELNGEVK